MEKKKTQIIYEKYCSKSDTFALVQEENNCVYLYTYIRPKSEDKEIRACWVRNYVKGFNGPDRKAMDQGLQPLMPQKACKHPEGAEKMDPAKIQISFLEDCDGVVMYYDGDILAVIPGGASSDEFPGYARDASGTSPFAWELSRENTPEIYRMVEESETLWNDFTRNNLWETFQKERLEAIEKKWGGHSQYYAIDNDEFPPKALVKIEKGDTVYLFTIGVSLLAQPTVAQFTEDISLYRRFELAFALKKEVFEQNEDQFLKFMVGVSNVPWAYTTFLADGHTLLFDVEGDLSEKFPNVMLLDEENTFGNKVFPEFRGDKTNLLWIVPITASEFAAAEKMDQKSFVKKLKSAFQDKGLRVFDGKERP